MRGETAGEMERGKSYNTLIKGEVTTSDSFLSCHNLTWELWKLLDENFIFCLCHCGWLSSLEYVKEQLEVLQRFSVHSSRLRI